MVSVAKPVKIDFRRVFLEWLSDWNGFLVYKSLLDCSTHIINY